MNKMKILFWISTGLLSAMMLMSASMYVTQHATMVEGFNSLGYPAHIIYPLAAAKAAGVIAILTRKSQTLKEWAYAGFTYVFALAFMGHINAGDGKFVGPLIAFALLMTSYLSQRKAFEPTPAVAKLKLENA